ncbi:MAG TPA: His/Gly/Thr/Pro-type tRNA ligase C-terminal domain-containing protein, partial [Acidimicrobiia bacterium]
GRSVKAQMKVAGRADAAFAVILGRHEAERDMVLVRDLARGDETEVHRAQIAGWLLEHRGAVP